MEVGAGNISVLVVTPAARRGYLVSLFALVWVANQYMSIYNRLRLDIKHEHLEIEAKEEDVEQQKAA